MNLLALALALVSQVVFTFADPAIEESSGLVDLGGLMVTTNDSGDDALLYVVDPATGRTVGRTAYARAVLDVEALAPAGDGEVWAADIGDNGSTRTSVTVYRVPVGRGEKRVDAPAYRLVYPDGPHDAESLVQGGGRLYVISKEIFGGTVYAAPPHLDPAGENRLTAVGRVGLFATDAALFGDGRHVLVRGYGSAEIRTFPDFRRVAGFALPDQEQGEGVSIGPGDRIRLSSEGAHSAVLQVELPDTVRARMDARPTSSPTPSPTATPSIAPEEGRLPPMTTSSSPGPTLAIGAVLLVLLGVGAWSRRRRRR